ncbi:voltage-gated chloride channel family protein,CIC family [Streptococcus cristatus]|uniref:Voltage-gated chloride channel n=2 Tax=Streptococcus cristatus TaxID=45634 RepID=A0A512AAD5_STRCR|nr:chloride channel protein [Streptococcus cristatus]AGK70609.1 voltage-gated chloride channel family protein,CIC family [Streptococcus cristatus AS 1.3089]GEN96657.1 voltage-gated chloride channel [Streptococcus cristatus]SQI46451.1 voltage-gated chloride channel family protein,CIC family [Streptococcus cristatus]
MLIELRRIFRKIPYNFRLFIAVILQGIVSGLSGIFLHYLLELVEEIAFGQSEHNTGFLTDGVASSRIGFSLIIVGISSALVWYFLQRKAKIFSIKVQMKDETSQYKLHFLKQLVHSIWQIIAVGGGAPIGKSAAPREIGALFARPIANIFSLSVKDQVFLIACGAGAGLAAVYQVPLTSVFFVFETLGIALSLKRFFLVGLTTYVSTYTAGLVISDHALYQIPSITWSLREMWIIPLLLLFLTPLAWLFGCLNKEASSNRIKDKRILLTLPLAFLFLVGLVSHLPHLLGNGRMMAQEILNGSSGETVLLMFFLKAVVVLIILWAGAYGGTLTPSFALGMAGAALLGMNLGDGNHPSILLLGSVCFLSVTLRAPLSATGLVIGFTGLGLDSLPYLLVTAFLAHEFAKALDRFPWANLLRRKLKNRAIR